MQHLLRLRKRDALITCCSRLLLACASVVGALAALASSRPLCREALVRRSNKIESSSRQHVCPLLAPPLAHAHRTGALASPRATCARRLYDGCAPRLVGRGERNRASNMLEAELAFLGEHPFASIFVATLVTTLILRRLTALATEKPKLA